MNTDNWFDWCDSFHNGLGRVSVATKWNYINKEGRLISKTWLDWAFEFGESYGSVKVSGKWYRISKNGRLSKLDNRK